MFIFRSFSMICLLLSIMFVPCYAQPSTSTSFDLRFLEDFAKDLYLRGEIRQAQKEFERIKRIDPKNALANEYLSKFSPTAPTTPIETKTPPSFIEHTQAMVDDIKKLKEEIQQQEQNIDILKTTLRNSLAENDTLYVALDKRTREVIELRKQLYNLPNAPTYQELMENITLDRIAQQPFSKKEALSILNEPLLSPSISLEDVQHTETLLEEARTTGVYDPMRIAELQILLDKQRAMLADKNEMLTVQSQTLTALTQELSSINESMSSVEKDFHTSTKTFEEQYQQLLDQQNKQTLKDQEIFLSLLADYSTLIKRIQEVQTKASQHHTQYAALEEQYKQQSSLVEQLNNQINLQTDKIKVYEKIITAANQEIEKQESMIKDQQIMIKDLSITQQYLNTFHQSLLNIQNLLGNTDTEIASLQQELNHIRTFISNEQENHQAQFDHITQAAQATSIQTAAVSELKQHIRNIYTNNIYADLPSSQRAFITQQDAQQQISQLNEILKKTEKELYASYLLLNERDENILDLEEQLQIMEYRLTHLNNMLNKEISEKEKFSKQKDLLITQLKKESNLLHDTLSLRDQELQTLHQDLFEKEALLTDLKKTSEEIETLRQFVHDNEQLLKENTTLAQELANMKETHKQTTISLSLQETSAVEEKQQHLSYISQAKQSLKEARSQLTTLSLELQEKEFSITALQNHLKEKTNSLIEAAEEIKKLEEQMVALEFKQKAMHEIAQQREQEILFLEKELNQTKQAMQYAEEKSLIMLKEKTASLENELLYAKQRLEDSSKEALKFKKESEDLRKDLMIAQTLIERYKAK